MTRISPLQANDVAAANVLKELEDLSEGQQQQQLNDDFDDDLDFYEEDYEEEESSDEEDVDTWDPSLATPIAGKKSKRKKNSNGNNNNNAAAPSSPPSMAEIAALEHLNAARAIRGKPPASKLTIPELRAALEGTRVRGQEWKAGNKKRKEMLQDYFALMGEQAGVQTSDGGTINTPTSLLETASTPTSAQQHVKTTSNGRKSPFAAFRKLASRNSTKSNNSSASSAPPKGTFSGSTPATGGIDTMTVRQLPTTHVRTYDDEDDALEIHVQTATATSVDTSSKDLNSAMKQMKLGSRSNSQQHDGSEGGIGGGGQTLSGASAGSSGSKASREPSRPAWVPSAR